MHLDFSSKLAKFFLVLTILAIGITYGATRHVALASSPSPQPSVLVDYGTSGYRYMQVPTGAEASSPSPQPSVLVDYGTSGYRYMQVPTGADQGFQAPAYNDSSFQDGTAAFGLALNGCPLDSTIKTNWASNTDMLVRRDITLPAGTTGLAIHIAIDNDAALYWNGTQIGSTTHEGCAARDTLIANVPNSVLAIGKNVLAIRGTDRGSSTYLDLQVVATPTPVRQCTSESDYCTPTDWDTLYVKTLTSGVEPLNVIISARSTVPLSNILAALGDWSTVGCVSNEKASVTGNVPVVQKQSWRLEGCVEGNILSYYGEENHARLWKQPVPGSDSGAWFISASFETACVNTTAGLEPLDAVHDRPISKPWHCIDGGPGSHDKNGYDDGAAILSKELVQAAHKNGWYAALRTDTRPAGIGEDGVGFSGMVDVVTVDFVAPSYPR